MLRKFLTDGRIIRLGIVAGLGLIVLLAIGGATGVIAPNKSLLAVAVTPDIIPTREPIAVDDPSNSFLLPGDTLKARVEPNGYRIWEFPGSEGEVIDIMAQPVDEYLRGFDLVVEVYAPSGNLILELNENSQGQPESRGGIALSENGTYSVYVSDNGLDDSGDFELTLLNNLVKRTFPERLGLGNSVRNELKTAELQTWVFSGKEGQVVSFSILPIYAPPRDFLPRFTVFAPEGDVLISAETTQPETGATVFDVTLPTTGTYTIWISEDEYNTTGWYAFSLYQDLDKSEIRSR